MRDAVHQIDGAGDIGIDDMADLFPVLFGKGVTQTLACVGQRIADLAALRQRLQAVGASLGAQVGFDGIDLHAIVRNSAALSLMAGSSAAITRANPSCAQYLANFSPILLDAPVTMASLFIVTAVPAFWTPTNSTTGPCGRLFLYGRGQIIWRLLEP